MPTLLIDISHPAHVHFFKTPIKFLSEKGWKILLFAKRKDSVFELLKANMLDFFDGGKYKSNVSKLIGIIPKAMMISKLIKLYDINIVAGIHPVHASIAARLARIPCIGFSDTEHSIEQLVLFVPNCEKIYTPACYKRRLGKHHYTYPGFHELSYLHPKYFKPDDRILDELGLLDRGYPILFRTIAWDATHDIRIHSKKWEKEFLKEFGRDYDIIVSTEGKCPSYFQKYGKKFPRDQLHSLLAFSRLYIGHGGTTASEAAMLGTPALLTNPLRAGTFSYLEYNYGLLFQRIRKRKIFRQARLLLNEDRGVFRSRRKKLLEESCDVAKFTAKVLTQQEI